MANVIFQEKILNLNINKVIHVVIQTVVIHQIISPIHLYLLTLMMIILMLITHYTTYMHLQAIHIHVLSTTQTQSAAGACLTTTRPRCHSPCTALSSRACLQVKRTTAQSLSTASTAGVQTCPSRLQATNRIKGNSSKSAWAGGTIAP